MHSLDIIPSKETRSRIALFQHRLGQFDLDGALITQNVDLFYFTGSMQNGILYIPTVGEPLFFVRKSVERAVFETSIHVEELKSLNELEEGIFSRYSRAKRLGIEADVLPYKLALRYSKILGNPELVDISFELRQQRAVKSDYEIANLKKAAIKTDGIFLALPHIIKEGITEIELIAEIEYRLRKAGNINIYRMRGYNQELALGMVASGFTAAVPTYFDGPAGGIGLSVANPQSGGYKQIRVNEPILIDIGTVEEGYIIDQTRLAVINNLDTDMERAYEVSRIILQEVQGWCIPGTSWEAPYLKALEIVEEHGLLENFMGFGKDKAHFLGHGVGLELDELPILARGFKQPLIENMIIAIEPKFTFPKRGVVGLENTYKVGRFGLEQLTVAPENIIKIKK